MFHSQVLASALSWLTSKSDLFMILRGSLFYTFAVSAFVWPEGECLQLRKGSLDRNAGI